jgi:hypothetical protein
LLELFTGHSAAALEYARRTLEIDSTFAGALMLLRDDDLRRGNPAAARARYAEAFPALLGEETPVIDGANADAALDLALVLKLTGENERANELLLGIEKFIAPMPRMNVDGFGVADVQMHALRGDDEKALAALGEAVEAGWRGDWRYYRDFDPALAGIRDTAGFKALFRKVDADISAQRARVTAQSAAAAKKAVTP